MKLDAGLQNMGKKFQASLDQLYDMLDFIRDEAKSVGFEPRSVSKIELACEEALVNIIQHGYPDFRGNIEIFCLRPESKGIKIVIKDHGIPFNPLSLSKKEGTGYGIFFIIRLMDEVSYVREENSNILTLVKFLA